MADKAHRLTDKELERMERHLSAIYSQAGKEIEEKWKEYLDGVEKDLKSAEDAVLTAKKAGDDKAIKKEEKKLEQVKQEKIVMNKHYKDLLESTTEQLAHANEIALGYINDELPPIYSLNYNATGKGIANQVKGYSFELTDANTVKKLATAKEIMLPKKKLDIPADMAWNAKKVNSEVLQGIVQGDSMDKIAKRMRRVTDMNATSAIRNARTMVTSAENSGRLDGMRKAEEDGIEIKKEWIATSDGRTRHWHAELDGVQVGIDEPFENEFGKIMFPGDPSADGANVYNCRCSLGSVVLSFAKKVAENVGAFAEEVKEKFVPAKTIEEAEQYADRFVESYKTKYTGNVNYKGVELQYANEINRAISEVFDAYDTQYPLKNIIPINKREARFKGTTAEAAYQWGTGDLFFNKDFIKSVKANNDHIKEAQDLIDAIMPNIDVLIGKNQGATGLAAKQLHYAEALKQTGRSNVTMGDTYGNIVHEMGHFLDDRLFRKEMKNSGFDLSESFEKYSKGISAYATASTNEYVAESFASYWIEGGKNVDPNLISIFERMKKQ